MESSPTKSMKTCLHFMHHSKTYANIRDCLLRTKGLLFWHRFAVMLTLILSKWIREPSPIPGRHDYEAPHKILNTGRWKIDTQTLTKCIVLLRSCTDATYHKIIGLQINWIKHEFFAENPPSGIPVRSLIICSTKVSLPWCTIPFACIFRGTWHYLRFHLCLWVGAYSKILWLFIIFQFGIEHNWHFHHTCIALNGSKSLLCRYILSRCTTSSAASLISIPWSLSFPFRFTAFQALPQLVAR